jgi:hypothetical protein
MGPPQELVRLLSKFSGRTSDGKEISYVNILNLPVGRDRRQNFDFDLVLSSDHSSFFIAVLLKLCASLSQSNAKKINSNFTLDFGPALTADPIKKKCMHLFQLANNSKFFSGST